MAILAIDTSTIVSGAAIVQKDKLVAEIIMQLKLPQSEVLLGHVQDVLKIAHMDKSDLTGVAISIGPGSFTGLRIGLATAKMLSYALSIPVVAVSSLEAMAYHYPVPGVYVASVLDAQKSNAYFALYEWNGKGFDEKKQTCVMDFEEVAKYCSTLDKPVVFVGDIAQKKADIIAQYENVSLGLPHLCMPRASNVAMAAKIRFENEDYDNIMDLEPVYIRRSEAEVLWEKRHGEKLTDL